MWPFHKHIWILISVLFAFSALTAMKIHGWSISRWHSEIDGSPQSEILMGHSRDIRSDDWLLDLPLMISQSTHQPRFPLVNRTIGLGQQMLLPMQLPVKHWSVAFRPFTWGFLFGVDTGLAWMWWSLALGLFYFSFLTFMVVSKGDFRISILAAAILVSSPYFQIWSYHKAPIAIFWFISFLSLFQILLSKKKLVIWVSALTFAWALIGMVLGHLYPPIIVTFAWLLVFASAALIGDYRREAPWKVHANHRMIALVISLTLSCLGGVLFFADTHSLISLIQNTVYPGQRLSNGGGGSFWRLFTSNLVATYKDRSGRWAGNICEAASFYFTFPVVLGAELLVWRRARKAKRPINPWALSLGLFIVLLLTYSIYGLPGTLAHWTLLDHSTSNRILMALGVADLLLLVSSTRYKNQHFGVLALWVIAVLYFAYEMNSSSGWLKWPWLVSFAVLGAGFLWLGFVKNRTKTLLLFILVASVWGSFWFNPWVRGGSEYIFKNPLSERILHADDESHRTSRWVVWGDSVNSNLLRMLGVTSLGGYQGHPQFELWTQFDPQGKFRSVYNQSAFINFMPGSSGETRFDSPSPGVVNVWVDPGSVLLKDLGVDFFLTSTPVAVKSIELTRKFHAVETVGRFTIFKRDEGSVSRSQPKVSPNGLASE